MNQPKINSSDSPKKKLTPEQLKRKGLISGESQLTQADFGTALESFREYQKDIERGKAIKGVPLSTILKGLHSGKSEYSKFIPGGAVYEAKPKMKKLVPLFELKNKLKTEFNKFLVAQDSLIKKIEAEIKELGYKDKENPTGFDLYHRNIRRVTDFVQGIKRKGKVE